MDREQNSGFFRLIWTVAGLLAIVVGVLLIIDHFRGSNRADVRFTTPYQAVLLSNGSVYFGKLAGYGGPAPVLTQVYYIVSQANPDTKQVSNILVKRGKELHAPDRMYLNPRQIVFVEPVGPNSQVAQKIAEQTGQ